MRELRPYVDAPAAPVHVVAAGCCTPVGQSVGATAIAIRAGVTAFGAHPCFVDKGGKPLIAACVETMAADLALGARLSSLARSALRESMQPLHDWTRPVGPVPLFVGTRERDDLDEQERCALVRELRAQAAECGVDAQVHVLEDGGAAGSMAIQAACAALRSGHASVALAGGVDSFLDWNILEPLEEAERIHSSVATWGFCPGESAAFLVLADDRTVRDEGWTTRGRIVGAATAVEAHRIGTPSVCIGQGLTAAMRQSLAAIDGSTLRIGRVFSDMNGEPYRGDEYGFSMVRLSHHFTEGIEAETPADCWGHVGAATGPLAIILATEPDGRRRAEHALAMSLATSDNGYRTAVVVAATP